MKKLICIVIAALMLLSAVSLSATAEEAYNVNAYSNQGEGSPTTISLNSTFGIRLKMNAPFNGVSVRLSTYVKTDTVSTVSVYKWSEDFEETLKADPVASKQFDPVRDNLKHDVKFDAQPAGEYLVTVRNDNSQLCIWVWDSNTVGKGLLYADGAEKKADINITVSFTEKTDEPFSAVQSSSAVTGKNTAPAEYVPESDSAVVVRASHPTTWEATDELGRTLPTYAETGGPREDKTVALFYWSWHVSQDSGEPLNVQKVMDEHPEAIHDYNNSVWPKKATVHFWNESIYGFYKTNDIWVLRRHAELLADAGVDVLFFDNTNGTFTWRDSYIPIYETFTKALEDGVNVPKISFLLPFGDQSSTMTQLSMIYQDIYLREKYQKLWFYWDGKPMVMAHKNAITGSSDIAKELRGYFTFRGGQPGYLVENTSPDTWGWLSTYPQATYKSKKDKENVEEITVGVAVNHNYKTHQITAMNGENVIGRTYTSKGIDTREDAVKYGANFAEQFDYALEVDPKVIFITGWNEWIAGRYKKWPDSGAVVENAFPDEFNDEFSRDLEPTKGRLRDNYYYQLVSYIRKYKGCEEQPVYSEYNTIDVNGGASQWESVPAGYIAYPNNTGDRDAKGYGSYYYKDSSGRNDITDAKVAKSPDNVYFMVKCADKITPFSDKNWMNLYIDCADEWGWESFDYVVGAKPAAGSAAYLQKFTGTGYERTDVCELKYSVDNDTLTIEIPKSAIGISGEEYKICFKWTDNVQDDDGSGEFKGEILDFYRTGDVAPGGRFKYAFISTVPQNGYVTDEATGTNAPDTDNSSAPATDNGTEPVDNTKSKSSAPVIIAVCAAVVIVAGVAAALVVRGKKKK